MLSTRVLEHGLWSYDLLRTVSKRIIANALIDTGLVPICQLFGRDGYSRMTVQPETDPGAIP